MTDRDKWRSDFGLRGPVDMVLEAYDIWVNTDFKVLPFSGGWLDQPDWIRADFRFLSRYSQWRKENPPVNPATVRSIGDVFG